MVAAIVLAGALWLVRSQRMIGDVAYMKAVLHHSMAVMTSGWANIRDPQLRLLASRILDALTRSAIGRRARLRARLLDARHGADVHVALRERDLNAVLLEQQP